MPFITTKNTTKLELHRCIFDLIITMVLNTVNINIYIQLVINFALIYFLLYNCARVLTYNSSVSIFNIIYFVVYFQERSIKTVGCVHVLSS